MVKQVDHAALFRASLNRAERAPESSRLHDPNVDRQIQITTKTPKKEALHHTTLETVDMHKHVCSKRSMDSNLQINHS